MAKEAIHLGFNDIKSMVMESLKNLTESYLGNYGMSGCATYIPGDSIKLSDEEAAVLGNAMQNEYTVCFDTEDNGGDNWETPRETNIVPSNTDVQTVMQDIERIPDGILKDKIRDEFNTWIENTDPEMDYNEPDYEDLDESANPNEKWFRKPTQNEGNEEYQETNNTINNMGQINEDLKKYMMRLVKEAMEENAYQNNDPASQKYVIQTKTGGYLMEIRDDQTEYDDDTLMLNAMVGNSVVAIKVSKTDYMNLVNNGESCDAEYRVLNRGGNNMPESFCTLSVYNG